MAQLGAGDTVTFNTSVFPIADPATIALVSPLPVITIDNVTIDGTNAGVILDGSGAPSNTAGLMIHGASNVVIKGLHILHFPHHGIELSHGASDNTIGGRHGSPGGFCSGDCNLISGNGSWGLYISDSGTTGNTVSGNYIGTNASGTAALGNNAAGVTIESEANYNIIGGDTPEERNLISGNYGPGVQILFNASYNTVSGNYVGTDASGTLSLPNNDVGVQIGHASINNVIGGDNASPGATCTGECNLISGNNFGGVSLGDSGTDHNVVSGNYIGTNVDGTAAVPNHDMGVYILEGGSYNTIGGTTPGERNLISGNDTHGVSVGDGDSDHNTIIGNYIGTDVEGNKAIGNGSDGVHVWGDASQNLVGESNIIAFSGSHGVVISDPGAVSNTIRQNSIHSNSWRGIDLSDGGNIELPAPDIWGSSLTAGTAHGVACANCIIEIFSDDEDEGRVYEGTTIADSVGVWDFAKGSPMAGPHITATATDAGGNTSEFGPHKIFLPIILKQYPSA
jgi:titin